MKKLYKIREMLNKIFRNFAAGSGNNHLRLRFGSIRSILNSNGFMISNGRNPYLDRNAILWASRKGILYVSPKLEANPHIVISGMSGFGKSTLFKSILLDIRTAGIACIVFDAHNEHSDIVRAIGGSVHNALYSGINILELDGASVSERISELSRLFKEIYSLGYIQTTKLSECLWYTYRKAGARSRSDRILKITPSIRELIDELNIFIRNSRSVGEKNTLLHLKDRLSLLNNSAFAGGFINMRDIHAGLHSFSLANMKSKEAQLIYIGELLNRLYGTMHDSDRQNALRLYIMIDEAQFLVDNANNNSIIAKLIEEGRKYGVGVIIVTHAASTLNRKIMANSSTFATFYAREPSEVSYISKIISGNNGIAVDAVKRKINNLRQNQVILVSSYFRNPVVVDTPKFNEVKINSVNKKSESEIKELLLAKAKRAVRQEELGSTFSDNCTIINGLVASGFLDRFAIEMDGIKERWLMVHNNSLSIEHEVWVRKLSELLDSIGMQNQIIDNSNGPDIAATKNGKRIAVEYETGSKSFGSTSKMIESRIAKYDKVVIVTNESVVQYYKKLFETSSVFVVSVKDLASVISSVMT